MKPITFFLLLCFGLSAAFTLPYQKEKTYGLQEAIDQHLIELLGVEFVGDKALKIRVKNLHKRKDISVHFPTGLQFASQDTSEQDQLIIRGRTILVKAGKSSSPSFTSYCTQANYLSPGQGSTFSLKKEADGDLLKLASFLSNKRDLDYLTQQAIWVVSDDHDLKGLHDDDPQKAMEVQTFVSNLTGKPLPPYTVLYQEAQERRQAFTREAIMIYGVHRYELAEDGHFSCNIYNEEGQLVQEVFNDMLQKKGNVRFTFKFKAWNLPKGKYVSRIFKGGEVFDEIWVETT